jgi:serine phosphatase RsbU (regulator of sigma subunit)
MQRESVITSTVIAEAPSALSRTRARLTGAQSLAELRAQLTSVLALLYRSGSRAELFIARGEHLVPTAQDAEEQRLFRGVLASLRTRLVTTRRTLSDPQSLGADETTSRRAAITAPVYGASEDLLGLIVVEGAPSRPAFDRAELVALEGVAALVSVALQRLDPAATMAATATARRDLDRVAASRMQRGFMSSRLPPGIGITARAEYLPAFDVGGDFYAVKYLGDRTVTATIGDVSGNGVAAALLMSRVTADLERFVASGASPCDVLSQIHARLAPAAGDMFVTAACVKFDIAARRLTVANAGHLPMIVRRANDEVFTFGGASGVPLGMMSCDYAEDELGIERGDIFLMLTDGLLEALDPPTGHRGMELLVDEVCAAGHDVAKINERIRTAVERARESHPLDDVTWVGLQLTA